jgi:hypothetical protein
MKLFGWICAIVALGIAVGTVLVTRVDNRASESLCRQGRVWACSKSASPAAGLIVAGVVGAFAVPTRRGLRPDGLGGDGTADRPLQVRAADDFLY